MKNIILLLCLSLTLFSCSADDTAPVEIVPENKVLLLKVDLETYTFEGGKELLFPAAGNFTIYTDYTSGLSGNMGNLTIKYAEVDQIIFDGNIVAEGAALVNYPEGFDPPGTFALLDEPMAVPQLSAFENIQLEEYLIPTHNMGPIYPQIWEAISDLELVQAYRQSNPSAKIYVFHYASTLFGPGLQAWNWYVILKN